MADGVAITAGSGTTILTDDTGAGGHAQVVKLAYSADGVATLIPATVNGLAANVRQVGTLAYVEPAAGTTATAAFAAGDMVGTEISFTNAVVTSGGFGEIVAAHIVSDSATTPMLAMDLYLFNAASTPAADNAANSWSDANMLLLRGIIRFPAPDVSALNTVAVWTGSLFFNCAATTLFGCLVTRGVWTPVSTAAPIVGLTIRQYAA